MLSKVKLAKRISTTVFDAELLDLIAAAIADLKVTAGIEFNYSKTTAQDGSVTDYVVTDPLVSRAIVTYCVAHFGSPADYDRLKASYDEQKGQLRETSGYGLVDASVSA